MNRIKSYTVIELLVVMVISALTISMIYACYRIFSGQYIAYKNSSEEIAQYILLDRLLIQDVSRAERILKSDQGLSMKFNYKEIKYDFTDSSVIRTDKIVDTFNIRPHLVQLNYNDLAKHIPDQLVDEISFKSIYKEDTLHFLYKKKYAANVLMSIDDLHSR